MDFICKNTARNIEYNKEKISRLSWCFIENQYTQDASQKREKGETNEPDTVLVEDGSKTDHETSVCMAIYEASRCCETSNSCK